MDTFQNTVKYLKEDNISNNKKWLPSFYHFLSGFLKKFEFFTTLYQIIFRDYFERKPIFLFLNLPKFFIWQMFNNAKLSFRAENFDVAV